MYKYGIFEDMNFIAAYAVYNSDLVDKFFKWN